MHFMSGNDVPIWEDGDVVRVRFVRKRDPNPKDGHMLSDEYTYVRTDGYWPGDAEWSSHTDHEMTEAWNEMRLSHMVIVRVKVDDEPRVLGDPTDPAIIDLRIAQRRIANVIDILDKTLLDRPLSSFIDELNAVLGR